MEILDTFFDLLINAFNLTLNYFNSPNKRIYFPYIISSFIIAVLWFYSKKRNVNLKSYLFPKEQWLNRSAYTDYIFIFLNLVHDKNYKQFNVSKLG